MQSFGIKTVHINVYSSGSLGISAYSYFDIVQSSIAGFL